MAGICSAPVSKQMGKPAGERIYSENRWLRASVPEVANEMGKMEIGAGKKNHSLVFPIKKQAWNFFGLFR